MFLCKLLGFDFTIIYKPGKENVVADALSRSFEDGEEEVLFSSSSEGALGSLLALSLPMYSLLDELKKENLASPSVQAICAKLSNFGPTVEGFMIKKGMPFLQR